MSKTNKLNISAVIITLNEAENISEAINSVKWADEIIVVDSGSADETVNLAKAAGAKVFKHSWEGYAAQKNLANGKAKSEWILSLDADERVSDELREEIRALIEAPEHDGYYIPRRSWFLGRWIKHCHWYPDYQLRLFRKDNAEWTGGEVHEHIKVTGSTGKLKNDILHYTYKDIADQTERLNKYSTLWAKEAFARGKRPSVFKMLFSPFFTFINVYILRLGFLDGFAGLVISRSLAYYSFQKKAKLIELYREAKK